MRAEMIKYLKFRNGMVMNITFVECKFSINTRANQCSADEWLQKYTEASIAHLGYK